MFSSDTLKPSRTHSWVSLFFTLCTQGTLSEFSPWVTGGSCTVTTTSESLEELGNPTEGDRSPLTSTATCPDFVLSRVPLSSPPTCCGYIGTGNGYERVWGDGFERRRCGVAVCTGPVPPRGRVSGVSRNRNLSQSPGTGGDGPSH